MKKSVKKNYIYNLIYQITALIVPLILTPYISKTLLADGVGQSSFSYSLINYFVVFGSLGFWYYAQREIAKYQGDKQTQSKIFWEINICRAFPIGISLLLNLILVAAGVYKDYTFLMLLSSFHIVSAALDIVFFFQGNEEFGKIVSRNILVKVVGTILTFVLVKDSSDVWVYVLLTALISAVSNLSLWFSLRGKLVKVSIKEIKPFKHFSGTVKLFIPTIAASIYTILDRSLIGIITQSNAHNGYYEQADKIVKVALTLVTCLGTVMIPRNSNEFERGNVEKVQDNIYKASHFVWLLGMPIMFGMIAVSSNLVPWFLGSDFEYSIGLLQCFSSLILLIGLSNVLGQQYLLPVKKDNKFSLAVTIGTFINLILNILMIYYWQSLGAAIASIFAELSVVVVMLIMVRKELSVKKILNTVLKPFVSAIIMFMIIYPLSLNLTPSMINTFILVVVGIIIYGFSILLLRDKLVVETLNRMKNKKRKLN